MRKPEAERTRILLGGRALIVSLIAFGLCAGTSVANEDEEEQELLHNPGFEYPLIEPGFSLTKPEGWLAFSSVSGRDGFRMTTEGFHAGDQALHVASQDERNSFQGLTQEIPVEEDAVYEFSLYVHNDPAEPLSGTVRGQMSIEWKNARGEEIRRQWGPEWNRRLARHEWTQFSMTQRAPRDAVTAVFGITQFNEQRSRDGGAFYLDSVSVKRKR